ncbi:exoribonuclease R [Vibrio parahaemolyticus]|uniref:exoribonuclease R n=1 Tax=Vibrio parahaemolyticus TaxID=670 RepID=UPI001D835B27|nr:exoribonuclease R [Vibrio parahaemolyticus]EGR3135370.1 exoribonuclease R [Vibrio parahaemolyticus]EGR3158398.1 exoribonuclease R [Vibrio parahaemolyticus]EHY8866226.1 exoribonuclease R [Vibrio parahaemolyticus]EII3129818.1 exoribonuclease R [Vibrio parahaemolyticus]EJG1507453.1 exoribonuclease R [Vibrio parahaemolyticus]
MLRDYTFDCLVTMPRHELEEFSARMISKMVPEDVMNELFTFDQEEVDSEDRMLSARLDAMLRMTAIALSEIQQAFDDSDNAKQNSERMTRLVLWHFYAISFHLEEAITLETHCELVEKLLENTPSDVFAWVKTLTELLHTYAEINAKENPQN